MRTIIYIDPAIQKDQSYYEHLKTEIPARLKLLADEYSATAWTAKFADDLYGDEEIASFTKNIKIYHDEFDAIVVVPNAHAVDANIGTRTDGLQKSGYLQGIVALVSTASNHNLPVIAYVDEPGAKTDFNLTMAGITSIVDHVADPALLSLKIAKAVNRDTDASGILKIGALTMDMKSGNASYGDKPIHLTAAEKALFLSLLRNKGTVRSKESLLNDLYQFEAEPEIKIVDVFTTKLRRKLNEAAPGLGFDLIRTNWGNGYFIASTHPENRIYHGMLRLDPLENGSYQIADTSLTIGPEEYELFQYLQQNAGSPQSLESNFILSHHEALERLNNILSGHLISFGPALDFDEEEQTVSLNRSYFDIEKFDANDFSSLLRQEVVRAGSYQFIRQTSTQYILQGSEATFTVPEVKLLENLCRVPNQAVRARALYNHVLGSGHNVRGQRSQDEEIVSVAKNVFRKLSDSGRADDENTLLHIYHDEFLSFGPADEVPDPKKLDEERKERLKKQVRERLESAAGKKVELERIECGYFTLLVHPVLKDGVVEGTNVLLNSTQTKIIETILEKRPAIVSARDLFEAAYPNRPFNKASLSVQLYGLRRDLKQIHAEADSLLTVVKGYGYVAMLPGDEPPQILKETRAVVRPVRVKHDVEVERTEVALRSDLILLQDPESGSAKLQGTNIELKKNQVDALVLLSDQYPRTVYEAELVRKTGTKGVKGMISRMAMDWAANGVPFPLKTNSLGFVWQDVAFKQNNDVVEPEDARVFSFAEAAGFTRRCEKTGKDFTVREAELLIILDERKGQTLDAEAIRGAASQFKWPDNVIEQTLTQVVSKIKNTGVESRLTMEKRRGGVLLLTLN